MNDVTIASTMSDNPLAGTLQVIEPPTDAHYYEIYDPANKMRAGLNVLLDPNMHVIRAELYFYERYGVSEQMLEAFHLRAKEIVETSYLGNGFTSDLQVIDGTLLGEATKVTHRNPDPPYRPDKYYRLWHFAAGFAAFLLVLLVIGLLNRTLLLPAAPTQTASLAASPTTRQAAPPTGDELSGDALAGAAASVEEQATALAENPALQPNTNGLPVSQFADNAIEVGMLVRIIPGYRSYIRTEPGADAGEAVGLLENGATALVLGGPTWLEGNSDTIVWWYVRTTEGNIVGWTPANTSELTLLEPAQ